MRNVQHEPTQHICTVAHMYSQLVKSLDFPSYQFRTPTSRRMELVTSNCTSRCLREVSHFLTLTVSKNRI